MKRSSSLRLSTFGAFCVALGASAAAQQVSEANNREWITVSGAVASSSGEMFVLNYGKGSIKVEVDDFDWFNENRVPEGSPAVVAGRMDHDFFQNRTIEATAVYVPSTNTIYIASAADEENLLSPGLELIAAPTGGSRLTGRVTAIDSESMKLRAGAIEYTIKVDSLSYDPFDQRGLHQIEVGERVAVTGTVVGDELFEMPQIQATSVVEIRG